MRVLILHSKYLSGPASGENRVVDDEAALLREAGHEVETWTPSPANASGLGAAVLGAQSVWSRSASKEVRRIVRERRIEVVHCHNLFPMLSPAVLRAAADDAAVVVTLHNYRMMCLPAVFLRDGRVCEDCLGKVPWRGVVHRCYRNSASGSAAIATSLTLHRAGGSYDKVTKFLSVSEFVKNKHVEAGIEPGRIDVKPNFTWPAPMRGGEGEYFLYLGRLSSEKGLGTLIDVWRRSTVGLPLVVVGDGPQSDELRAGAPSTVKFVSTVAPSEVPDLIARARAVLVPSVCHEGAPRVVLEAYAGGVPVVASAMGALPELVVDGESGFLVADHTVEAWTEALRGIEDPSHSRTLGTAARELWQKEYSPQRGLEALEEAYTRAVAHRAGA